MKKIVTLLFAVFCTLQLLAQDYKKGTKVEILWSGSWYKGSVIEVKDSKYKITYEGWSSSWDEWVGRDRLRLPGTKAAPAAAKTETKPANSKAEFAVTEKVATPAQTGAHPAAGKWEATVTNGYKGDKITFTVAADGKTIKDVEFKGYWKDGGLGSIAFVENLGPPNPFKVAKGGFSAVQQVEKARMWWEFTGRFVTATTAEGTYRAAYAGGYSDTYVLKWTAKRVGK
ncbi:MAG: Tudor-knot domain-containing protein [Chitinophagaceae bacterium]